jgi:hypothetical protein
VCGEQFHCQFVLGIYAETIGASFGFVLVHYRHYRYFQLSKDIVLFKVYHQVCEVQEFIMSIHNYNPHRFGACVKDTKQEIKSGSYGVKSGSYGV